MAYLLVMHVVILILALLPALSFAAVEQSIALEQRPRTFRFTVTLRSTENSSLRFALSGKARNLTANGLSLGLDSKGDRVLGLPPGGRGQLVYELPYTQGQRYYLSANDRWTPVLLGAESIEQNFVFRSRMLPGYEAIDSATGKSQEELDLVLCDCRHYTTSDNRMHVYLLKEDSALAQSLLESLTTYLAKFEAEIGPYPYDRFSVVESAQEVGLAFPKMTWIGSELLHLPFILRTSLPHELLHSWWGNGVFVDYQGGNWCEGLTTFGADYGLLSEEDKKLYRLKALTSYMDYASGRNELPLAQFVSRGEDRSLQAIGYDKALMVFLMAEDRVGAPLFRKALREFYERYRFRKASFTDFFALLGEVSGQEFSDFERYWVQRPGMLPASLLEARYDSSKGELRWSAGQGVLAGLPGQPIDAAVAFATPAGTLPLALRVRGDGLGLEESVFPLANAPQACALDRDFRLFRALSEEEKPLTFSQAFAAEELLVASSRTDLAPALEAALKGVKVVAAPAKPDFARRQVLLLTAEQLEKFPEVAAALSARQVSLSASGFRVEGREFEGKSHSLLLGLKVQNTTVLLLSLSEALPTARWLQRWTHYGAKNYLVLNATGADLQGLWVDPFWRKL